MQAACMQAACISSVVLALHGDLITCINHLTGIRHLWPFSALRVHFTVSRYYCALMKYNLTNTPFGQESADNKGPVLFHWSDRSNSVWPFSLAIWPGLTRLARVFLSPAKAVGPVQNFRDRWDRPFCHAHFLRILHNGVRSQRAKLQSTIIIYSYTLVR